MHAGGAARPCHAQTPEESGSMMKARKVSEGSKRRKQGHVRGHVALGILLFGAVSLGTAPAQQPPATAPAAAAPTTARASALAEKPLTLSEVVQQAVLRNPEVLSRFHAIKAAGAERDAIRGGLYPRVDLQGSTGPERRSTVPDRYTRSWATLSLTQLLWDGRATLGEIERLDHVTRVRVFELLAETETVGLEVAKAYYDVMRYRELVKLAEDNFVQHRAVYAQTEQRVKAKIARAVDLEQITGRLALAEANLVIETSNLHDTTVRFQRLVGRVPSGELALPTLLYEGLPESTAEAVKLTQEKNPSILAAIENVRASDAATRVRNGSMHPRVEFRLKRDQGRNLEGLAGNSNATTAEVVLNWNLFNGNSDRARDRQFIEQANIAREVRDKTCRDTRQITLIAFNESVKLQDQTQYLLLHEASLEKAMEAYRQQFQIGQRTLLDLLDTENELFQSRRAVVNARYDLHLAYARSHAAIGNLLSALRIAGPQTGWEEDLRAWVVGADVAQQCPVEVVKTYEVNKDALVQKALELVGRQAAETRAMREAQRSTVEQAAPAAGAASAPGAPSAPGAGAAAPASEKAVRAALETWRDAWARRDVQGYLRAYAPDFTPAKGSRAEWEKKRRAVIGAASDVSLTLDDVQVTVTPAGEAQSTFDQAYRSKSYQDRVRKTLAWRQVGGEWRIVRETAESK